MRHCKRIAFFLASMLLVLSSCQQPAPPRWTDYFTAHEEETLSFDGISEAADEYVNIPMAELTAYSYDEYCRFVGPRHNSGHISIVAPIQMINTYHEHCPVESVYMLDDDRVCFVSKVAKANGEWAYAYTVFPCAENIEYVSKEHYFITKALSHEDFSHIEVGDSLTEAYSVDPAVAFDIRPYENISSASSHTHMYLDYYSVRLLTDGVLIIQFNCDVPGQLEGDPEALLPSSYKISDITFYEYGSTDVPEDKYAFELTILQNVDHIEFPS